MLAYAEHLGSIPGLGRSSGEGNGKPLQYSAWKISWRESMVGYSPWGRKESDTTERLYFTYLLTYLLTLLNSAP